VEVYKDQSRSFEERAADLVSRMTLEEKIMQVGNNAAAIPRLGLPRYDYWSEASHGFFGPFEIKQMDVTSYPVCLAMSQSWDRDKIRKVTEAISDECRAHHNLNGTELHMWCPTINLARDPRNGRSDENFGEDPFLAGKMAASYIRGLQGDDDKYIKVVSTPKHYALNSSENNRHTGSSNVDEATLREYYARVFEYAIREGKAQSIMSSYNRVNGVPSSVNDFLLTTLLREEWGFNGFVVSDCGAVADCYYNPMFSGRTSLGHYYCKSLEEASAMTLIAGTDISCGSEHKKALLNAVKQGLVSEDIIDRAAIRALTSRFRLGLFDDPDMVPYNKIGAERVASKEQAELSVDMANDTIVLLKNDNNLLPLSKEKIRKVLVIGPNAIYRQLGGYSAGQNTLVDTPVNIMALDGIRNELADTDVEVKYEKGWCTAKEFGKVGFHEALPGFDPEDFILDINPGSDDPSALMSAFQNRDQSKSRHIPDDPDFGADNDVLFARALEEAKRADVVIVVAGTDDTTASEELDRVTLDLPYDQDKKILELLKVNPNTVVVLTTLGAVTGKFFDTVPAIINAHFAGQAQGTAIANVLFGKVNPNAKLTATWYRSLEDIPMVNDYGLKKQDTYEKKARTYMYFDGPVLFPFGHGLSYTTYEYSNLKLNKKAYDANDTVTVSVDVRNAGDRDGAEIVQVYFSKVLQGKQRDNKPIRQLKGFRKVWLKAGETITVTIEVPLKEVTFWSNLKKKMVVENGLYNVEVGTSSANLPCAEQIQVYGEWNAQISNVYAIASKYVLNVGSKSSVKASATLEDATHLDMCEYRPVFISSDESILTVDECGRVIGKRKGVASVTVAVTYKGVTKSAVVPFAVR
jgi:beta-glucosidase